MITTTQLINETICLTSLANGHFEYFDITCVDDLKEAYRDFDKRIAHDTDIELQYIDGVLTNESTYIFEDILELSEELEQDFEVIRDIYNCTLDLNQTRYILNDGCYCYILQNDELGAFEQYLFDMGFFEDIPEHLHFYLDFKKLKRDYEIEGLQIHQAEYGVYLFIY